MDFWESELVNDVIVIIFETDTFMSQDYLAETMEHKLKEPRR